MEYNKPIEVTKKQYHSLMNNFGMVVAGRKEAGKFYIKIWLTKYSPQIKQYLYGNK